MAQLVLYGNKPLTSPYVFSVFIALAEKGLPFDFGLLSLESGEQHTPQYVAQSVTNRVPTLTHGDFSIAESSAITEYLEEVFPPPQYARLYPADPRQRARVRMVQSMIRSDFLQIRAERSTETIFQGATPGALSVAALGEVERLCRIATQLVSGGNGTLTGEFTIADADLALMLQRLLTNRDPMPEALATYANAIWQRPSVQKWLERARESG
jgi:glutathione S-transferase